MHTVSPTTTINSGAAEHPLLTEAQLVPGHVLTGVAAAHAWEVVRREGDRLIMQRLPRAVVAADHVCDGTTTRTGTSIIPGQTFTECTTCGRRDEPLAGVLPRAETTPIQHRFMMLVPRGPVQVVDPYTAYVGLIGAAATTVQAMATSRGAWSAAIPIIPQLHPVWTLPPSLRALLAEADAPLARGDAVPVRR